MPNQKNIEPSDFAQFRFSFLEYFYIAKKNLVLVYLLKIANNEQRNEKMDVLILKTSLNM